MSFGEVFGSVFSNYASFSGRARRSEYWKWYLINMFVYIILLCLIAIADSLVWIYVIWPLTVLIPSIAVTVRRLHDTGKSGAYIFISFIPVVGPILLLVALASDSEYGNNAYGPNPKGIGYDNQQMMY